MTDKQTDALRLADELEDSLESHDGSSLTARCQGIADDAAAELRRQYAEIETLRAGYAAARLEIESLKAQLTERAPHGQEPAAQQAGEQPLPLLVRDIAADFATTPIQVCMALSALGFGGHSVNMVITPTMAQALRAHFSATAQAAPLYKDSTPELHIGDSAFESWYSTYSPAHKSDKQRARDTYAAGMGDPLVTAAPAAVAWQSRTRPTWGGDNRPWSPWEPCTKGQAEDCWKTPLLHEWAYEARALYAAPQPSPAAQGDALDAARYRFLRDGEWRDTDLEPFIRLQLNTLWDAKIDAARKQGANHD